MKRTLVIATTSYAGMGPYVSEIVNLFSAKDNIFYFFQDYEDGFFRKNIKEELYPKSCFFKKNNSKWNKIKDLFPIKPTSHTLILKFCQKHGIKIVHFINNPGDKDLTKDLEKLGITCISTVHDLHPHESKKEWYKELRFKLIYKRLHENIVYAKNLITNSETQYEELKSSYPDKKIYYHSFPSLVTENIKNGKDMPLELETIDKPYILFFGRIEEYKGITLLYKVFTESIELSEHYTLVIAGRGTLPFTHIPNEKNVIIINRYIKDTEIAYMYQHAHCTVYPYISATQSGVLSLSFYFQTPTLTSDVPFFKKIIATSGVGMLFKNGNYNDLKSKLSQVCQSDMKAMTENGKKYYDTHYEGSVIRKKLIEIYNEL